MTFENDISLSLAQSAHHGTSWTPERRAEQERNDYAATLKQDYEAFRQHAVKGGTLDLLEEEFERFREGYRKRYQAYLHSRSRVVSWAIAGPSNFPARRMQKRSDIADRRLNDLFEFRDRARKAVVRNLRPDLRPIMSGDSDAVQRLQEELEKLEALQARMKAINAIVRRKPKNESTVGKLAELQDLGVSEQRAQELFKPDFCGRIGFADYELTNNSANIRRIKGRIEQLSRAKAEPETTVESESGIRLEDSPADNRVRLFFPDKPDVEIRTRLKSSGFRWTPSLECWQAYRNYRTIELAKEIAA